MADWKGILDKSLEIGGPLIGTIVGAAAGNPQAGLVIGSATGKLLDELVVKPYVPGEAPPPTASAPTVRPAAPPSKEKDSEIAAAYLREQGWSDAEVQEHLKGPRRLPAISHEHGAEVVHRVLEQAGWSPAQRQALLRGELPPNPEAQTDAKPAEPPGEGTSRLVQHVIRVRNATRSGGEGKQTT